MHTRARLAALAFAGAVASTWGGCGGETTGRGAAGDAGAARWALCEGPGECAALVPGCCGVCGAPTLADVTGVNADRAQEFRDATCTDPTPMCPECATQNEPNLVAFCEQDRCVAHDLRREDLSACKTDEDCLLRDASCCPACVVDPYSLVALASAHAGDYAALVCRPDQGCPACAPILPEGWAAACGATGHCEVVQRTNVCPEQQPQDGAPCTLDAGLRCEYGGDIRPGCRTHATCDGTWSLSVSGCPPLPGPGEAGCPDVAPEPGSSCANDGLLCRTGESALCACASCLGPCSQFPVWLCSGPPTTAGCPAEPPRLGTACAQPDLVCNYGMMCHPLAAAGRRCSGGAWVDEPLACPQ